MKKTITVFGSSKPKENEEQFNTAFRLGSLLAQKGFNVCTGGYQGIMNAVSKGANENGAEAIGITVNGWGAIQSRYLTKEIKCNDLNERLQKLISYGDGYVILQGGTGTLLELSFIWELMNKKLLPVKPIATHSVMWKEIAEIIDKQLLFENRVTGLVKNFETVEEIVEYISGNL
jgi:uncharacterized protein (TIGR00730 family)